MMMIFIARVHKTWMTRMIRAIKPTSNLKGVVRSMEFGPMRFSSMGKMILHQGQFKPE